MQHYSAHQMRALAVAAVVDPRTAARWLAGLPIASTSRERLEAAAGQLGVIAPGTALALASASPLLAVAAAGKVVA